MIDKDWYVNCGVGDFNGWIQYFFGFGQDFLFFFGVVVFYEVVDVGDYVEGNLFGEFCWFDWIVYKNGVCLVEQFFYGFFVVV